MFTQPRRHLGLLPARGGSPRWVVRDVLPGGFGRSTRWAVDSDIDRDGHFDRFSDGGNPPGELVAVRAMSSRTHGDQS